ncbi:MAG: RNA methyltransferase [Clostridia bacterium]|nr:RNA methyltransferase [Clostridia bacterium]
MQKPQEFITSRQNPLVVLAAKLAERKHREAEGLFRFDGKKLFLEALAHDLPLVAVLLRESAVEAIMDAAGEHSLPAECRSVILPDSLFDRISEEKSPEGVMCLSKRLDKIHKIITINKWRELAPAPTARVLFLESVRDPGNLGTIVRAARAFGVDALVLSADCADIYNPRVLRAAMGTLFHQHIFITGDFVDAVRHWATRSRVFAATLGAQAVRLGQTTLRQGDAVVVGNEGHGLTQAVIEAATDRIYIPMEPGVESLNAGVAASVLLWELYRGA